MARPLVFLILAYVAGIVLGRFFTPTIFILPAAAALLWALWQFFSEKKGVQAFKAFIPLLLLFLVAGGMRYYYALAGVKGNIRDFGGEKCTLVGMVEDEPLWRGDDVVFPLRPEKIVLEENEYPVNGKVRVTLRLEPKGNGSAPGSGSTSGSSMKGSGDEKRFGTNEEYKDGDREGSGSWYADNNKGSPQSLENRAGDEELNFLSYGQQVSLKGALYEPQGQRNPGGFAYRDFLETQGMAATFYGAAKDAAGLGLSPELSSLRRAALQVKGRMSAILRAYLPAREGNLLVGMLFGERSALEPETEDIFSRSGAAHLLAVSGLHCGLVAGFLLLFWRRLTGQGWPAFLLSAFFLFLYVFLCGFKPAALRAFFMFLLAMGAVFFGRQNDLPTALAAAAFITLLFNPLYLFSVGFQLSYAATAGLIFFASPLQEKIRTLLMGGGGLASSFLTEKVSPLLAVTLAAQIGVLPLTAYYFREISLVALFTNVLILPVMALVLGIGLFSVLLGLILSQIGAFFNLANYPLLAYMLFVTAKMGSLPFSYIRVYPPHLPGIVFYYVILLVLAGGGGKYLRSFYFYLRERVCPFHFIVLILLSVLVLTWWGMPGVGQRSLEVIFLDVGQGDAIFIRTPRGRNILLDGGGKPAYQGDITETGHFVVVPFLEQRRVKKLDLVIISHPHEDHYGGLFPVLERFPVKMLATNAESPETGFYAELLALAREKGISREILEAGDHFTVEPSLKLTVLNPPRELWQGTGSDKNNNSLILHLRYKETGLLLTGDAETKAIEYILGQGKIPPGQVLKIPHHGGALPNLPHFLDEVEPWAAVISVGPNSFGHPHSETLAALQEKGLQIFRTDQHGAVTLKSNGRTWEAKTMLPLPKVSGK